MAPDNAGDRAGGGNAEGRAPVAARRREARCIAHD